MILYYFQEDPVSDFWPDPDSMSMEYYGSETLLVRPVVVL